MQASVGCGSFESSLVHKVIGHCQYTICHVAAWLTDLATQLLSYDICSTVKGLNDMTYYLGQTYTYIYTYCVAERVVLLSPKFKNIIFLTETCANMFCILLGYQYRIIQ